VELAGKKSVFKGVSQEVIDAALKNIFGKKVDLKKGVEPNLYVATLAAITDAIDGGFSGVELGEENKNFIDELKASAKVFAAFKTHRQQNDIARELLDEAGKLKPFNKFVEDTKAVIGKYNKVWLRTEFDTAVIRARQAANFKKYQEDSDLFPNLKWLPSTSPHPREVHTKFYGLVLPQTDDFWRAHYPGNDWNCKCGITNTDQEVSPSIPKSGYTPAPGLDENPGITGEIFTKSHPYVTEAYPGAAKAVKSAIKGDKE